MSYSEERPDDEEVQTPYIVKSPNVCFGKARIRGTRMAVVFIAANTSIDACHPKRSVSGIPT